MVGNWVLKSYPRAVKHLKQLLDPIREAIQALENAGLVMQVSRSAGPGGRLKITRAGEEALEQGIVTERLNA